MLAYLPLLHANFVWDDFLLLKKNPLVTGELSLRSVWFQTDFPLSTVGFYLEYLAFGQHPLGYHLVNLLLHTLSVVLVWRLLLRLQVPGAWLAAALFAVHPVCVASVAWISELKNTLSLPFFLLSLWLYLPSDSSLSALKVQSSEFNVQSSPHPPSSLLYPLSFLLFLLALLAKTSTVTLPVVLLLICWWQHGRVSRSDLLRALPFFALALLFGLLSIWFQSHQAFTTATVQTESFWGRLAGAGLAVWFYLSKALLPLNLNAIYPRWTLQPGSALTWLPSLALGAIFVLGWVLARRREGEKWEEANREMAKGELTLALRVCFRFRSWARHLLFALACFVVTLFPALGFFDMYFLALSRVSDHFAYLSLIPLLALLAAGMMRLDRGRVKSDPGTPPSSFSLQPSAFSLFLSAFLILTSCLLLTFQRTQVWATNDSLWRDTLAKNPAAWTAHNNLACLLAEQHQYDQALPHFEASIHFNPENADAQANLGQLLALQGRFAEAEPHFRTALQLKPDSAEAHRQFAGALARQGRLAEALLHLREAVRLQPSVPLRQQYAGLLYQSGHSAEAIAQLRVALAAQPNAPELLNNLAWLLATSAEPSLRNGSEAVGLAERACQLTQSKQPQSLGTLAAAYAEAGRFSEAVAAAEQARDLARAAQQEAVARQTEALLTLYRAGTAYHERGNVEALKR